MRHLVVNFVSCGSSLLIRRKALDSAGGYDPRLRAQGKQGTEDYLLQLMIARQWRVAMVPEYLVGYRRTAEGMSSDSVRMARSRIASLEIVAKRFPDTPAWLLEQAVARAETTIFMRCLRRGRLAEAMPALRTAAMSAPATALAEALFITRRVIVDRTRRALRRLLGLTGPARRFDALPPEIGHGPAAGLWLRHQLCAAAALEGPPAACPGRWRKRRYPDPTAEIASLCPALSAAALTDAAAPNTCDLRCPCDGQHDCVYGQSLVRPERHGRQIEKYKPYMSGDKLEPESHVSYIEDTGLCC